MSKKIIINKNNIKILNSYNYQDFQKSKLKTFKINKNKNQKSEYNEQLKTHSFSLNKIENFIYEKCLVIGRQYDDVSIDINLNNELVYRDNRISNPYLIEKKLLYLEVIKLPKRYNEWKQLNYDQVVIEENCIEFLQRKHLYNVYVENIKLIMYKKNIINKNNIRYFSAFRKLMDEVKNNRYAAL